VDIGPYAGRRVAVKIGLIGPTRNGWYQLTSPREL
jgi:hypothetical protein